MAELVVADLMLAGGHNKINKFYLQCFSKAFKVLPFLTSSFNDKDLSPQFFRVKRSTSVFTRLQSIFFIFYLCFRFSFRKNKVKVVFLSYDPISLFVATPFLKLCFKEVFLFEHNTVPTNKIKAKLFNLLSNRFVHLTLEEYISDYIAFKYNKKCKYIGHPIVNSYLECGYVTPSQSPYVFAPSSNVSGFSIRDFFTSKSIFIDILAKGLPKDSIKNGLGYSLSLHDYFESYDKYFSNSSVILIPMSFDYRVSGVFYEALSMNKPIIIRKSKYSEWVLKKYKHSIFVYDSYEELESILNRVNDLSCTELQVDINIHNTNIENNIRTL